MFFDLHCDLLSYLASSPYRLAYNPECRVSIDQLMQGRVQLQTMAIYAPTDRSSLKRALKQLACYNTLPQKYPGYFAPYNSNQKAEVLTLPAIENASGFFPEEEKLTLAIKRFKKLFQACQKPLYMSVTWNTENRFGGGNETQIGLKEDGRRLLYELQDHIHAIDFSHTSDRLAHDLLEFIDREKLSYAVLASHSNFRTVTDCERNLPATIADEIVHRDGIIGLNLIRRFIGSSIDKFLKHVEYGLTRGYGKHLALGADFFYEKNVPPKLRKLHEEFFFPGFESASCYPALAKQMATICSSEDLTNIASQNMQQFLKIYLNKQSLTKNT